MKLEKKVKKITKLKKFILSKNYLSKNKKCVKKIKPVLCKTFPFNKVQDAHIYMEKGLHFGKIALTI